MADRDDWRLRGQEDNMQGMAFRRVKYVGEKGGSDHTHCEFCWHKFMENSDEIADCSDSGYRSCDGRYWVCEDCFANFKTAFGWTLKEEE